MSDYGKNTKVTIPRSKAEIEEYLNRHGIREVTFQCSDTYAGVIFRKDGALYRLSIRLPLIDEFHKTETGRMRDNSAVKAAWEQECKATWRRLLLIVKAKFVIVEENPDADFKTEFMGYRLLPNCRTAAEQCLGQFATLPVPTLDQAALCDINNQEASNE